MFQQGEIEFKNVLYFTVRRVSSTCTWMKHKMDGNKWKYSPVLVWWSVRLMHCSFINSFTNCLFYIRIISLHPLVKPSKAYSRGSVVMVDEIINASPSKYRFPEAGLRVMVTSHFGPKTRLRMASRLIITEVKLGVVAPKRGFSCYCYMLRVPFWACSIFRSFFISPKEFPYLTHTVYMDVFFIYNCRNKSIKNMAVAQQWK